MKRILCALLCMVFVFAGFTACSDEKTTKKDKTTATPTAGIHHVEMTIKDYGTIKIELDADQAPISVANFLSLAESGFYDGTGFHRYVENFVLQGGAGDGSAENIKGEFAANGVENTLKHTRGAISMARAYDYNSGSSQFFICLDDMKCASLDGQYAAFGYVTDGMDIIDKICSETPVSDSIPESEQPIIETVKVID